MNARCWLGHAHRVVSSRPVHVDSDFSSYDATRLLRVCTRCGKPSTKTIKGSWDQRHVIGGAS